jgi:hypothetical protein
MSDLAEDQKLLIKLEVAKCLKENEIVVTENKKVLTDLRFYRWVLRAVFTIAFTVVLGGSVAGFLLVPGWIDSFVAARVKAMDELLLANGDVQTGDFRSAYDNMSAFMSGLGTKAGQPWDLSKLSDPQKNYFFSTLITVLAYNPNYDPSNLSEFRSKDHWQAMLRDPEFQRSFPADDHGYNVSPRLNQHMALAYLRYAETKSDLEQANKYLHYINSLVQSPGASSTQGPPHIFEGLVLALLDKKEEGIRAMAQAGTFLTRNYSPFKLSYEALSGQALLGMYDAIFSRLWTKFSKGSYPADVCTLFHSAFIAAASSRVPMVNDERARNDFLKDAISTYVQVKDAIQRNDLDSISKMLEVPRPESELGRYVSRTGHLDTENLSAIIYDVPDVAAGPPIIIVRFFSVSKNANLAAKESCSGSDPHGEEFWGFYKHASDQNLRLSFFDPPNR